MNVRVALVGVLAVFGLSACGTTPGAQEIPQCQDGGFNGAGCPVVVQYEDRDLHCVSWDGSQGETGLTCDFVRFHAEDESSAEK